MLNFSLISRRILAAAIAASAFAVAVIPAASADAAESISSANWCKYGDTKVSELSADVAAKAVHCLTNKARLANGLPKIKWVAPGTTLQKSAQGHAERSATLRWWNPNDGASSHVDPETGTHPDDRIAAAGYCKTGHRDSNENTFTSSGVWQYPATPNGAVNWWLSDPPHRATIMNPLYKAQGVAVVRGLAIAGPVYDNPGTFVVDFGACNGKVR
jgi:uncharacterized protein YkwD